jgi:hypothetical protein
MQSQSQSAHNADAERAARIKAMVDTWPPLTEEQRAELRVIMAPAMSALARARWANVTDRRAATKPARDALAAKRRAAKAAQAAPDASDNAA